MDVREKILEAAAAIYSESGFRGTTTRRVAQAADVNEVTLFRHFGSKEAMLRETIARCWESVCFPMLPEEPVDPTAELSSWALQYAAGHRSCAAFIRTRLGEFQEHPEIMPPRGSPMGRATLIVSRYLECLRERGRMRADVDINAAAAMLISTVFADALLRDGVPEMYGQTPEDDVRSYVRIFVDGIGAR